MVSLQILDKEEKELILVKGKRKAVKEISITLEKQEHIVSVEVGVWRYYPQNISFLVFSAKGLEREEE
jgi:hypothetical protein